MRRVLGAVNVKDGGGVGQEGRNQWKVLVAWLRTLPNPGCPGEPTTLLTDIGWIPSSVAPHLAL